MPSGTSIPENLALLHEGEKNLRKVSLSLIDGNAKCQLHLSAVKATMDMANIFRQFETADDDIKLIQLIALRAFNAFGASLQLVLSGYSQNGVLVMRDLLENAFLLDLFRGSPDKIEQWRTLSDKKRQAEFKSIKVRQKLDERDGFKSQKRKEHYKLLSELAGHLTMKSDLMLRQIPNADAQIGPFIAEDMLNDCLTELGRLAIMVGDSLKFFFPESWKQGVSARHHFLIIRISWLAEFYPSVSTPA